MEPTGGAGHHGIFLHSHHRLHSSALVRLLQHWMPVAPGRARREVDVGEEISQWLSTVDAVTLSRALRAMEESAPPASADGQWADVCDQLNALVVAARADLAAVVQGRVAAGRLPRARADNTPLDPPDPVADADFAPHSARYLAAQKQIEARLTALRAQVRSQLAVALPPLRPLAELDAVMEQVMAGREQRLWATLAGHLERRMAWRRERHDHTLAAAGCADDPVRWKQAGGWLHAFERDLQALLQAEIEVRLEPVLGLLEAAQSNDRKRSE